jgi:hypothetical protein
MGLIYRYCWRLGRNSWLSINMRSASPFELAGPITLNGRGGIGTRLGKELSWCSRSIRLTAFSASVQVPLDAELAGSAQPAINPFKVFPNQIE